MISIGILLQEDNVTVFFFFLIVLIIWCFIIIVSSSITGLIGNEYADLWPRIARGANAIV